MVSLASATAPFSERLIRWVLSSCLSLHSCSARSTRSRNDDDEVQQQRLYTRPRRTGLQAAVPLAGQRSVILDCRCLVRIWVMGYAYMCEARDLLMFIGCVTPHPNVLVSFMRTFFCYYIRTPAKQSHGMRFRMIEFVSTIQANCGTNSAAGKVTVACLPVITLFLRDLSVFTFNKMTS